MGGIIPALQATGNTLYTIIQDALSGQYFNGSTMENYNLSNIANYCRSNTEDSGSGRFRYTVSGSLPAGRYFASPYVQSGGSPSPAIDTPLDILFFDWDGANIVWLQSGVNISKVNGSAAAAVNLAASAGTAVIGAAAAGTLTTSQMTTNLTATVANTYAGRVLYFTSGANIGFAVLITAYAVTGGRLTVIGYNNLPLPVAPSAADTFIII